MASTIEQTRHDSPGDAAQARHKAEVLALLNQNPFRPPWWMANPHLQTVGARYVRKVSRPELRTERWDTPDDDFLQLHFLDADPAKPTVLLLHGLEGSVDSTYMLGMIRRLAREDWNVVALDFRSCGAEINRAPRMYHSGETTDAAFVVQRLIERRPDINLYLAGYSLGANVIAKWFGESGDALPPNVKAGAVVSAPYDLVVSSKHMDHSISRGYVLHFLRKLRPKAIEKHRQYPEAFDLDKVLKARSFRGFDDHATAPLHGFEDAHDYYTSVACGQFLDGIRRPTLLLSSEDDPFNPRSTLPYELADRHPYLHAQFSARGGHVGFVHADDPRGGATWADEQIARFFTAYHERL